MSTHVYAEYLPRIQALSIQASLPTPSNNTTEASIPSGGNSFTLSHGGEVTQIVLPVKIPQSTSDVVVLPIAVQPKASLEFRIPLGENSAGSGALIESNGEDNNIVPWTAPTLSQSTEIYCRACNTALIARGTIQSWRDLPSENWAEMMDFWHCHKPHEPDSHEHGASKKGYSAESKLYTIPAVGFVDAASFLLAVDDCQNIKKCSSGHQEPALSGRKVIFRERVGIQMSYIKIAEHETGCILAQAIDYPDAAKLVCRFTVAFWSP